GEPSDLRSTCRLGLRKPDRISVEGASAARVANSSMRPSGGTGVFDSGGIGSDYARWFRLTMVVRPIPDHSRIRPQTSRSDSERRLSILAGHGPILLTSSESGHPEGASCARMPCSADSLPGCEERIAPDGPWIYVAHVRDGS